MLLAFARELGPLSGPGLLSISPQSNRDGGGIRRFRGGEVDVEVVGKRELSGGGRLR